MDGFTPARTSGLPDVAGLAAELATLKRVRDARSPDSLASILFRRAWHALCEGLPLRDVALSTCADALVALRLGGIDADVLTRAGLSDDDVLEVRRATFDEASRDVPADLATSLRGHVTVASPVPRAARVPDFVEALIRQPRAGATCPGKTRLMLEPPEGHGDHCLAVAVLGVLLCPEYGADPATVFLAGVAHHLHNATLPDSGFAGEMSLGRHLGAVLRRLVDDALATLPPGLAATTRAALAGAADASTPEGRAFNAADVIDRVTEVRHFAAVARFTEAQALDEMQLVHAGPLQDFHHEVMRRAGLASA